MWQILLIIFAPPLLLVAEGVALGRLTPWALLNVLGWPAVLVASVALHEFGHALAARIVGLQVPRVTVGIGRELWRKRFGRTLLVLNSLPLAGLTSLGSAGFAWLRLRVWIAVAAGPVMNLALAWAAFVALPAHPTLRSFPRSMAGEPALLHIAVFLNAVLLIANLLPYSTKSSRGHVKDGKALLTLPTYSKEQLTAFLDVPVLLEVGERIEAYDDSGARDILHAALRARPDSWYLQLSLSCVESELGNAPQARGACLDLLQRLPSEAMEPIARASLAAINRRLHSPELREEADAGSAFALEEAPNHSWALGTRGTILVWLGRPDEAIPLLEKAYVRASSRRARSGHACDLVTAHAARGDLEHARRWIARAVENGGRGERLDEAHAAIKEVEGRATQGSQI